MFGVPEARRAQATHAPEFSGQISSEHFPFIRLIRRVVAGSFNLETPVPVKWQLKNFSGALLNNLSSLSTLTGLYNATPELGICPVATTGTVTTLYTSAGGATRGSTFTYDGEGNLFLQLDCFGVPVRMLHPEIPA